MSIYAAWKATFGVILFALVVMFMVGAAVELDKRFGNVGAEVFFVVIVLGALWAFIYRAARRNEELDR